MAVFWVQTTFRPRDPNKEPRIDDILAEIDDDDSDEWKPVPDGMFDIEAANRSEARSEAKKWRLEQELMDFGPCVRPHRGVCLYCERDVALRRDWCVRRHRIPYGQHCDGSESPPLMGTIYEVTWASEREAESAGDSQVQHPASPPTQADRMDRPEDRVRPALAIIA